MLLGGGGGGGQKYGFRKIGGASQKAVWFRTPLSRGGLGACPPRKMVFRLSEIESGAFSGTTCIVEWEFWKHL